MQGLLLRHKIARTLDLAQLHLAPNQRLLLRQSPDLLTHLARRLNRDQFHLPQDANLLLLGGCYVLSYVYIFYLEGERCQSTH